MLIFSSVSDLYSDEVTRDISNLKNLSSNLSKDSVFKKWANTSQRRITDLRKYADCVSKSKIDISSIEKYINDYPCLKNKEWGLQLVCICFTYVSK